MVILKLIMTILIRDSVTRYVLVTARQYLEMHALLGLHAFDTPTIEVKKCMSLGRIYKADKVVTILKDCIITMGAKPRVFDQMDIPLRTLNKSMD